MDWTGIIWAAAIVGGTGLIIRSAPGDCRQKICDKGK